MITSNDRRFISRAIDLASQSIKEGGGPFGAVVTREGRIIAESANKVALSRDPTAHAEILAIRKACSVTGSHNLHDCSIYCSCEPCPMCLGAIYWAGIKKVYYASDRSEAAASGFIDTDIYEEMSKSPEQRTIGFIRIEDTDARTVFEEWNRYENKVQY